jgi:cob(I)alamin adenosyltransferase
VLAALAPGTIAGWLTFATLAALVVVLMRGGIPGAVGELRGANEVLTKRLHNLNDEKRELEKEVAILQGKTDVAVALEPLARTIERHDERMAGWSVEHDRRADERHALIMSGLSAQLSVLELMAARMGKEADAD